MRVVIQAVMVFILFAAAGAGADETGPPEAEGALDGTEFDFRGWGRRAPVRPENEPERGLVEFRVSPEVFDGARPDLADLRVLAGNFALPWVGRRQVGTQRTVSVDAEIYNPTLIPGELNRITVDFGDRLMKDIIRVTTPGLNFKRRVLVEASQDAGSWEVLKDGAFLFDVSSGPGRRYRQDRISLPQNDFRYLRITVYHDSDDPDDVPVEDVGAWRREGTPASLEPVPVLASSVERDHDNDLTLITLDLGYRNLPLRRLRLDFEDRNFHRYLTLWGRNQETRQATRRLEGGGIREVTVEQPWSQVTSGHIHRYAVGETFSESLSPGLAGARFRYLQVRIHDGDDTPLTFVGAEADRYITSVAFPPRRPGPYWIYFDNPDAAMPNYDLVHYAGRLRSEGVTPADVGAPEILRVEAPEAVPLSEHYRWALWIALLGALALISWMVWRQACGAAGK